MSAHGHVGINNFMRNRNQEDIMKLLTTVTTLLVVLLCVASTSALGHGAPFEGWEGAQVGNATPPGGPPRVMTLDELDPVDMDDDDYPGEGEDLPGYGQWGPKDAGEQQPGCGHPGSGPRPADD